MLEKNLYHKILDQKIKSDGTQFSDWMLENQPIENLRLNRTWCMHLSVKKIL